MIVSWRGARCAGWALVLAAALGAPAHPVPAAEGEGCAAASWSLEADRAALGAQEIGHVKTGAALDAQGPSAFVLDLVSLDAARLPAPPERSAKDGTFAGHVALVPPPAGGLVQVTLADGAWIDLVRDGMPVKTAAFTGVRNCPFARKSVRFDVAAGAKTLVLQVSGAVRGTIGIALSTPR